MRIGTNHGSLSDRIMSRYGDTPLGMVESAFEFLRICEENKFYDIILSMKSSNPIVMVEAYRLLVNRMVERQNSKILPSTDGEDLGGVYPLHLGVTEAGEGEDGRIKSSVGIGTLLEDGLGDTIRVSLTEDPEFEIPVAKQLVERYHHRTSLRELISETSNIQRPTSNPFEYKRRETHAVHNVGGHNVPRVIADFSGIEKFTRATFFSIGHNYSVPRNDWSNSDQAADYIFLGDNLVDFKTPEQFQLFSATDVGGLLVDGLGDGVWLTLNNKHQTTNNKLINTTSFGILQATRTRISKTDYISCPSCGRTLFELQETTARIRARTNHLKGLKIAIMGCIVNGPGEMADADYGYVGTGVGKINLYKGKEIVRRNVQTENAVDELVELIKSNGDWVEETNLQAAD